VVENNQVVAIVPLLIEKHYISNDVQISYGGLPTPVALIDNGRKQEKTNKIQTTIFDRIDQIATEYKITKSSFRIYDTYLMHLQGTIPYNFLMKYKYNDVPLNTQIINLECDEESLLRNCSKGCKYNIKCAEGVLQDSIYDSSNISPEIFNIFKSYYFKVAGKTTRPQQAFDILFSMIKSGNAFIVLSHNENILCGVQYNVIYKQGSYYLMSAIDRIPRLPFIGSSLQWSSIRYLHEHKIKYYEIGWQQFGDTLFDFPAEKLRKISQFKRSFGGITVPIFSGERYYISHHFQKAMQERIGQYLKNNFRVDQEPKSKQLDWSDIL